VKNDFLVRDNSIVFKTLSKTRVTMKVMECVRRLLKKKVSKYINIFSQVFPYSALTKRPQEVRMGRGKAARVIDWVYPTRKGKIFYKIFWLPDLLNLYFISSLDKYYIFERKLVQRLLVVRHKISVRIKFFSQLL
jgi:hypothetical protein